MERDRRELAGRRFGDRVGGLVAAVVVLALVGLGCQENPVETETQATFPQFHHNPGHGGGPGGGGGGGGGDSTAEPTAEVTITTVVADAGLNGDGGGSYDGTFNGGNLWISPSCEPFREFVLDLSGQGLPPPFDQPLGSGCGFPPRLTIDEGLLESSPGDILGGPVLGGSTDLSPSTNYYFEGPDGTTYNVIWQAGICVTDVVDNGDGTTTYSLSTDPVTAQCAVDLASEADLVRRKTKGKPGTEPVAGDGSVVAHLDLSVRVIPAS